MVKTTRSIYVDAWIWDEALKRKINISGLCQEAIRKAVEEGHLSVDELKIYREHFGREGANVQLDYRVVFPNNTHFDSLDGKEFPVSKICRLLDYQKLIVDRSIFVELLQDIRSALPTFNEQKAIKIWDSVHGLEKR